MKNFILPLLLLCAGYLFGHQGSIQGVVYDENTRFPLLGASIGFVDTTLGISTNEFGAFMFSNLDKGKYTLKISYIGYKTMIKEVTVKENSSTSIEVFLTPSRLNLSEVKVTASKSKSSDINTISEIDIQLRPINSSQDILGIIPGLFIAQHAGGGKAEQIFLRGFDIDHGTDIALSVDGIPVNMVSHAHGQGYADLHFLIPETVEKVDFNKGPYYSNKGNFTTAGYAAFSTKQALSKSMLKLEGGDFNTKRIVGMFDLLGDKKKIKDQNAYLAMEIYNTDGYFESDQNFKRANLLFKYSNYLSKTKLLSTQASVFQSSWDASGQIPVRAVERGIIGNFGAIDDTEGGETSRNNISLKMTDHLENGTIISNQVYYSRYHFKLFSNFTFFLEDSINGDQILQNETRNLYGYNGSLKTKGSLGNIKMNTEIGIQLRYDEVDNVELSHTKNRKTLIERLAYGDIKEQNAGIYIDESLEVNNRFRINAGMRFDYFDFNYFNQLDTIYNPQDESSTIFSPKLSFFYDIKEDFEFFLKTGSGFHSNDTRVVINQGTEKTLPRALGADIGFNAKVRKNIIFNIALWVLYLEQEFVYVGDAGIVEPSGETRREGIDVSIRAQLADWLYADADINFAHPRVINEPDNQDYIPLATTFTSIGGLNFDFENGLNGSIRYRYLGDRPANEDNSLIAEGYLLYDALLNYTTLKYEIGISLENITNIEWREAQFETESRLKNEPEAVTEIHFTPGTPRFFKAHLSMFF